MIGLRMSRGVVSERVSVCVFVCVWVGGVVSERVSE